MSLELISTTRLLFDILSQLAWIHICISFDSREYCGELEVIIENSVRQFFFPFYVYLLTREYCWELAVILENSVRQLFSQLSTRCHFYVDSQAHLKP